MVLMSMMVGDIYNYQVKKEVIYLGWLHGLSCQIGRQGLMGIRIWFLGAVFPIVCLWLLFYLKMMGAGDIKALSVVGGFYGLHYAIRILIVSFLVGAVLSIIQVIRYKNLMIRLRYLVNYITLLKVGKRIDPYFILERDGKESVIPFTVAIAIAVIICTNITSL